ncbi:transposase [Streptomyces sp. DH24]|uniref:IS701 family transposase n=1 Tax=Streptomyces sp. DH24 TaxID=3040123 RepID=UPI002443639D|nr:transposase [Streptomyces sp. DH24]MDG9715412.1 transposase [Streptomyces sp. DH24]
MNVVALGLDQAQSPTTCEPSYVSSCNVSLPELCSLLFASLPRSDQRRKGMEYIRGLLEVRGRKSIRNIAALAGGQATEQSLHHFISDSSWEWTPVRRALARFAVGVVEPQAWVVRPMIIPKAGQHSVGVERRFFPAHGQMLNAQQAVGVWAVAEQTSVPVNWRLQLSPGWLDEDRRRRASIPDHACAESLGECTAQAYLETAAWGLPSRPVLMDAREVDVAFAVARIRATRMPLLLRVSDSLRLSVADPALPGFDAAPRSVRQIMGASGALRRPVLWPSADGGTTAQSGLVAAVRVALPGLPGRRPGLKRRPGTGDLLLLGVGDNDRRWPREVWLTDLTTVPPSSLMRLRGMVQRVDQDFAAIADQVGMRDFAGRSYRGWHRHVTLASAAHGQMALGDPDDPGALDYAS